MNYKHFCIICAGLALLTLIVSVPQSFADSFEPPFFKWDHSPTICAFEPSDPNFPNLGQKMLTETQDAVVDWETKLNNGVYGGESSWDMNLIEISASKVNSYNATNCDITIQYLPKSPYDNDSFYVSGDANVAQFPKVPIHIYYMGVELQSPETIGRIGSAWYYEYPTALVSTGQLLTDPQLQMTIRNELGHALGLANYDVSSEELYRIVNGYEDAPSIMVKGLIAIGINYFSITPIDVKEMQSIYGLNGFPVKQSIPIQTVPQQTLPNVIPQAVVTNQSLSSNIIQPEIPQLTSPSTIPKWIKSVVNWWSEGKVSDNEFFSAMGYLVKQNILKVPPTTSNNVSNQIPGWIRSNADLWVSGQITDYEFIRGIQYLISDGMIKL